MLSVRNVFVKSLPFGLDQFQVEAMDALDCGSSVLVSAPTGSGKTVVAQYAIALALSEGRRIFYTTPIKALSNQKFHDLVEILGKNKVGLLTGDNSLNEQAPVVVMTTEVLRNMIYARAVALRDLRYVVLDEVHYLQDPYRGPVWEEVIIHTPMDVDFVCLSATVSNADEIAEWISTVRGSTKAIVHRKRPIEIQQLYMAAIRGSDRIETVPAIVGGLPNPLASRLDPQEFHTAKRSAMKPKVRTPRRTEVVDELDAMEMLPCIYFIFSRAGCDEAVETCIGEGFHFTSSQQRERIREILDAHCSGLGRSDLRALEFGRFRLALESGIGAHHAGMIPAFKEAVETCFVEGLLAVVFATETLALGINMPARSVVIEKLSKFKGDRHQLLSAAEYTQLSGRAGRRGIDTIGFAATLWNPSIPFDQVAALITHQEFALRSAFRPTNNMAINLLKRNGHDQAVHLLGLSLAQFQLDADLVATNARIDRVRAELVAARTQAECDRGDIAEFFGVKISRSNSLSPPLVEEFLESLRPGDVVAPTESGAISFSPSARRQGWFVVVATARRRGRPVMIRSVSPNGKVATWTERDFRFMPAIAARISVPEPFNPNSRAFVGACAKALCASMKKLGFEKNGARKSDLELAGLPPETIEGCPKFLEHKAAFRKAQVLKVDLERLERQSKQRQSALVDDFNCVLELLERFGYVTKWTTTERSNALAGIFHEADLLISETLLRGFLDGLDAESLAALASIFIFEPRGNFRQRGSIESSQIPELPGQFPKQLKGRFGSIWRLSNEIRSSCTELGVSSRSTIEPGFVPATQLWAGGKSLSAVLALAAQDSAITGGDFVRTMKSLVDLLRQIAIVAPKGSTREAAEGAAALLFRGVVAASALTKLPLDTTAGTVTPNPMVGNLDTVTETARFTDSS